MGEPRGDIPARAYLHRNISAWLQSDPMSCGRARSHAVHGERPSQPTPAAVPHPVVPVKASLLILFGIGDGRQVNQLLESMGNRVIVVEPEIDRIRQALTQWDWSAAFAERLTILLPILEPPEYVEISMLETIIHLQQQIAKADLPVEIVDLGTNPVHTQKLLEIRRAATIPGEIEKRARGWPKSSLSSAELCVVSPRCQIFNDLAHCFQRLGVSVQLLEIPDKPREWSRTRWLHALRTLRDWNPPWTIQRNRCLLDPDNPRERMDLGRFVPGTVVSWWWDQPNVTTFLEYGLERNSQAVCGHHEAEGFAFAKGILRYLPPGSRWLPPAARTVFAEADITAIENNPNGRKIVFVGQSRFDAFRANLTALLNLIALSRRDVSQPLAEQVNSCRNMLERYHVLKSWDLEIRDLIGSLGRAMPAHQHYLTYLLGMCQTAAFRLATVESLRGLPLVVFGDEGWLRSKAITSENYRGPIGPSQLPALYCQDHLHLNLNFMQVSTTVNPRVLDIAASGGAVLTDHRPELDELFPHPSARPFSFSTLDELPDRCNELLKQNFSGLRRALASHVRAQHTMMHRARFLADTLGLDRLSHGAKAP